MDFDQLPDLAAERLGGAVLLANDEFFAARENLIRAAAPEWREGVYTERGKWMDGWETRRRRDEGHDWCIVRLGLAGVVRAFVVDTTHFRGNYPESCSIEGAAVGGHPDPERIAADADWRELLPRSPLDGHARNVFPLAGRGEPPVGDGGEPPEGVGQTAPPAGDGGAITHLRLNIFPDGGVARLRAHGLVAPDWDALAARGGEVDLAALEHGGVAVASSDDFFGDRSNMLRPGRSVNMGDGWETRRRRGPGHDWAIVRLGRPGTIRRVEIDTDHFKGNAPGACSVDAFAAEGRIPAEGCAWNQILRRAPLQPHTRHAFELEANAEATHLRLNIYPDGGVARFRAFAPVAP
jgi:allantoicase